MLLTRQSQIAISILVACARSPNRYVNTHEAAAGAGASKEHAAKIAHLLRRTGFVKSARGRKGGIGLAGPSRCISIGEVLCHTQPEMAKIDRQNHHGESNDVLASVIKAGWSNFVSLMNRFTLADLVADRPLQGLACDDCSLRCIGASAPAASFPSSLESRNPHASAFHG